MKKLTGKRILKAMETSALLREKLISDASRPGYHFATPGDFGYPGDPNMAFYAGGRYHLMYLYKHMSDYYRLGHLSSTDLLHWRLHGDAVGPDELDGGIFSGGAFVDDDGTAYMAYWALPATGGEGELGGIRIAYSKDVKNNYTKWEKQEKLAIKATFEVGITEVVAEDGTTHYLGCTDPSNIWKEGDTYYMQLGALVVLNKFRNDQNAPQEYKGDWTELYSSKDMVNWKHEGRFYQRDISDKWTDTSEDDMCPSFLPLPLSKDGGEMSDKYLQLFIAHNKGCQYYIGDYDKNTTKTPFIPQKHGRMSWKDISFFAPEALIDGRGRQIMWAWMRDDFREGDEECIKRGWSGVYSLPRTLWLNADGELGIAPASEVNTLRYGECDSVDGVCPYSCEVNLSAEHFKSGRLGLRVKLNATEFADVYYDSDNAGIIFDATTTADKFDTGKTERAPFTLKDGEDVSLTVYVDRSMVEIFVNDRQAVCRRIFANGECAPSIEVINTTGKNVTVRAWNMMETNLY